MMRSKSEFWRKKKGLSEDKISSRIVLYIVNTLRLKKALRVMWIFVSGGEYTLVVREPPAGPEKLSFGSPESTFSKILSISGSPKKSLRQLEFL